MPFLVARLTHSLAVLAFVATIGFVLVRLVGDPVVGMLGDQATPAERAALRLELGLDDPLPVQLARFAAGLVRGDLGVSYRQGQPVAGLFAERLPATLELAGCALALTLLAGLPLGVWPGSARDGPVRRAVDAVALLGASTRPSSSGSA